MGTELACAMEFPSDQGAAPLPPFARKTVFALTSNVKKFISLSDINHVGFLTLTFADHVTCAREAQRRFNSLATNILRHRYLAYCSVLERQKSGRIHYHLLISTREDIRTGVNWDEFSKGIYKSAPQSLRAEWSFWRRNASKYGFGRTELLPIRTSGDGIARYVGKYISKHLECRRDEDKGVRLVRYGGGKGWSFWPSTSTRFAWHSSGAFQWRRGVARLAHQLGFRDLSDFKTRFGPRWAWQLAEIVFETGADSPPSGHIHYHHNTPF